MQMQDELQDSLLSSELREHHSLTDEELAKQLQEKEILYEDYVSHKPIRNLSNQRPTTSTRNQRQVSTASTSGSLSDYDYRPCQSKKSNPNHGLETDENRDYNLAKYLQSEEEVGESLLFTILKINSSDKFIYSNENTKTLIQYRFF